MNNKKRTRVMTVYDFLLTHEYFTEEELDLAIKGWGDNEETYNTICQVRYAMDPDQLALEENERGENDFNITFSDYKSNLLPSAE